MKVRILAQTQQAAPLWTPAFKTFAAVTGAAAVVAAVLLVIILNNPALAGYDPYAVSAPLVHAAARSLLCPCHHGSTCRRQPTNWIVRGNHCLSPMSSPHPRGLIAGPGPVAGCDGG